MAKFLFFKLFITINLLLSFPILIFNFQYVNLCINSTIVYKLKNNEFYFTLNLFVIIILSLHIFSIFNYNNP